MDRSISHIGGVDCIDCVEDLILVPIHGRFCMETGVAPLTLRADQL
jgi:hypothetical protein